MKGDTSFQEFVEKFKVKTRHYSKYQLKTGRMQSQPRGGDYIVLLADSHDICDSVITDPTFAKRDDFVRYQENLLAMNDGDTRKLNDYRSLNTIKRTIHHN
jgi:tRNA A37 N6-isopentenylltransferase MiaA